MRLLLALVLAVSTLTVSTLAAPPALAIDDRERISDPQLEERARELFKQVRCVVCQNQSIDDSEAQIAKDLRVIIREQVVDGQNDEQILGFLTDRYGDFVLLEPPFRATTLLLWLAPLLVLVAGGSVVYLAFRQRPSQVTQPPLSVEEEDRLEALLARRERQEQDRP
ncbi:MAG: cytochrome c-type biogenesis protein [Pseudomonadota bacterium]